MSIPPDAVRVVHAADVHLDARLKGLARYEGAPVDDLRSATRRAFANLVDLAIEEAASLVIIAGDLFDGAGRDYNTVLFFNAMASRLAAADISVVLLAGNHDADAGLSGKLRTPLNVRVLSTARAETVVFDEIGIAVHGQGFSKRETFDNLAESYPPPVEGCVNIGVLHTSIDGRPGHEGYAPCSVDQLRSRGYDYWALGHVHSREVVSVDPWIVYSGCLQGRHARETGPKGATCVHIEDGRIVEVDHRDLDVVRWGELALDANGLDEDAFLDSVRDAFSAEWADADGRLLALRVVVAGSTPLHRALVAERERIVNELRSLLYDTSGGAAWLGDFVVKTSAPAGVARLVGRDDTLGALARTLRDMQTDSNALEGFWGDLADLRRKLPAELSSEIGLNESSDLAARLADVEEILLPRLTGFGV